MRNSKLSSTQVTFTKKFEKETHKQNKNRHNFMIITDEENISDNDVLRFNDFDLRKPLHTFVHHETDRVAEIRDPYSYDIDKL